MTSYVLQPRINNPSSTHSFDSFVLIPGSASFVNSTALIRPRPRTSPINPLDDSLR